MSDIRSEEEEEEVTLTQTFVCTSESEGATGVSLWDAGWRCVCVFVVIMKDRGRNKCKYLHLK